MEIKWQGYTSAVSLSATMQQRNFAQPKYGDVMAMQSVGPTIGTWSATVEVYRSFDGKNFVLTTSQQISNSKNTDIDEIISNCPWWAIVIKNVTGTIPNTPDPIGNVGISVIVGG